MGERTRAAIGPRMGPSIGLALRTALLGAVLLAALGAGAAAQTLSVREDGLVRFNVSTKGVTRISVIGQRIKQIISDGEMTMFESRADEQTGDLFLRYTGLDGTKPDNEGGYLITEEGMTVAYTMRPIAAETQTVLIDIKPSRLREADDEQPVAAGFADTSVSGSGGGLAAELTRATRETINQGIRSAYPTSGRNNARIRKIPVGDLIGEVRVAKAGKDARQVREQEFYRDGVLAVWVQNNSLGAGQRSWVVVVRKKR